MTNDELYSILKKNRGWETDTETVLKLIWGQPFDGETERITKKDEINTAKSASSTSPATEDSSAVLSESFPNGTTYTRSYQVFLPTPNPNPNPAQPNQ